MSRPLRLEYPGSLWHVTVRGNGKQDIFRDDRDRRIFLKLLGACVNRFAWILPAYVLMSNHFHLVIELTCETLSRAMHWLNGTYSQAFNRRHDRIGHLFQGRFKSFLIEKEAYFLEVLRYVVLNPVRAGMVARPEDYVWSSHRAVIGDAPAPEWLAVDDVLAQFGWEREIARARYRHFVDAWIGVETCPWTDLVGQIYLGGEEWIERVRERVDLKPRADDHPRLQRVVAAPAMATIVAAVATTLSIDEDRVRHGRGGIPRMVAAWIGWHEALLPNRDIAAGLRIQSTGHVSGLIRRCDRELALNPVVQECIDRCVATIRRELGEPKA
jgi:REP element-mobilizing transposase RayT